MIAILPPYREQISELALAFHHGLVALLTRRDCDAHKTIPNCHKGDHMSRSLTILIAIGAIATVVTLAKPQSPSDGKSIFRFDTFGDEQLWTDVLQMPNAL